MRYLRYFPAGGTILDAGCGRGEFMKAARERGFETVGVDSDEAAVAEGARLGLEVIRSDAAEFLTAHAGKFEGVFCAHLIEHLEPEGARRLVEAAAGALKPGGVLCLVTPNPGSLPTISHEFWRDPMHVRPYDLEALQFLCRAAGLEILASGQNADSQRGLPIDPSDLMVGSGESPPPPSAGQPKLASVLAAQIAKSRLARELQAVIHGQRLRIERLEAQVRLLAGALQRLLDVLYEPSEIFVVARKPG